MVTVNSKTEFDTWIHGTCRVAMAAVRHGRMFEPLLIPVWLMVWMLENTKGSTDPNVHESRMRIFDNLPNTEFSTPENHTEGYYYVQARDVIFILGEIKRRST